MNTAQPALFYLCPVILIFSSIMALIRREFKSYWVGAPVIIYFLIKILYEITLRKINFKKIREIKLFTQTQSTSDKNLGSNENFN